MSGVFNLLDKTGGIKIFISRLMHKLKGKGGRIACTCTLIFMLFGSFFGMFEELVTLLPIVIVFMLSINLDTMSGLGACLIASCFGFSSAITNPFSVGLASTLKTTAGDTTVKTNNYEDSDYGRFDLKIGLGAGVTIAERVNVKVGYNFGLLNRYTGEQVDGYKYKSHTGVFYVGAGFNF
jgi:hypothetical protein